MNSEKSEAGQWVMDGDGVSGDSLVVHWIGFRMFKGIFIVTLVFTRVYPIMSLMVKTGKNR